jgi:hypothetical protein
MKKDYPDLAVFWDCKIDKGKKMQKNKKMTSIKGRKPKSVVSEIKRNTEGESVVWYLIEYIDARGKPLNQLREWVRQVPTQRNRYRIVRNTVSKRKPKPLKPLTSAITKNLEKKSDKKTPLTNAIISTANRRGKTFLPAQAQTEKALRDYERLENFLNSFENIQEILNSLKSRIKDLEDVNRRRYIRFGK